MSGNVEHSSDEGGDAVQVAKEAERGQRVISDLRIRGGVLSSVTLAVLGMLVSRVTTGEWQSAWSLLSTWIILAIGCFPLAGWNGESPISQRRIVAGMICGLILGAAYGMLTTSLVKGVFFGAFIGAGSGWSVSRLGFAQDAHQSPLLEILRIAGIALAVMCILHVMWIMRPV